jgi:hypothetical protein
MRYLKPIRIARFGAFIFVTYPYRVTPDLYVCIKGKCFCTTCERELTAEDIRQHILSHDRRKTVREGQWESTNTVTS